MRRLCIFILVILCVAVPAVLALGSGSDLATNDTPRLQWIKISIGGRPVTVKAGGIMALHPDAPFMVIKAKSTAWLDLDLTYHLQDKPQIDLTRYHTLNELYGEKIFDLESIQLSVFRDGGKLGQISLLPRLLPIDWLRRAEASTSVEDKIKYTSKATGLTPDNRLLTLRLIDLLQEAKRYKEAAEILEPLTKATDDKALLIKQADLYRKLGEPVKEADTLTRLLNAGHVQPETMERLLALYEKLGRWQQVAAILPQLMKNKQGREKALAYRRLAFALQRSGKKQEAMAAFEQAAKLNPNDPDLWKRLAQLKSENGDEKGYLEALEKAAELSPKNRKAQLELAQAFLKNKDKNKAAKALEKALELTPKDLSILTSLAAIYEEQEDKESLASIYQRLSELKKDDPILYFNLAVLTMEMGDYQQALTSLENAQRLKPKDQEIKELILQALVELKRWDRVVKTAKNLLKQNPSNGKVIDLVHDALLEKQPENLARLMDMHLKTKPKDAQLYRLRAALALDLDKPKDAIKALKDGCSALPKNLDLKWKLATLYEAETKDAKALDILGAILDQNPDYPKAQEKYLQIKTRVMAQKNHKGKK